LVRAHLAFKSANAFSDGSGSPGSNGGGGGGGGGSADSITRISELENEVGVLRAKVKSLTKQNVLSKIGKSVAQEKAASTANDMRIVQLKRQFVSEEDHDDGHDHETTESPRAGGGGGGEGLQPQPPSQARGEGGGGGGSQQLGGRIPMTTRSIDMMMDDKGSNSNSNVDGGGSSPNKAGGGGGGSLASSGGVVSKAPPDDLHSARERAKERFERGIVARAPKLSRAEKAREEFFASLRIDKQRTLRHLADQIGGGGGGGGGGQGGSAPSSAAAAAAAAAENAQRFAEASEEVNMAAERQGDTKRFIEGKLAEHGDWFEESKSDWQEGEVQRTSHLERSERATAEATAEAQELDRAAAAAGGRRGARRSRRRDQQQPPPQQQGGGGGGGGSTGHLLLEGNDEDSDSGGSSSADEDEHHDEREQLRAPEPPGALLQPFDGPLRAGAFILP
jgi:hypothetical protein